MTPVLFTPEQFEARASAIDASLQTFGVQKHLAKQDPQDDDAIDRTMRALLMSAAMLRQAAAQARELAALREWLERQRRYVDEAVAKFKYDGQRVYIEYQDLVTWKGEMAELAARRTP